MVKNLEIPVYKDGKIVNLKIEFDVKVRKGVVVREGRVLNAREVNLCEEFDDLIIGSTALYILCKGEKKWLTITHLIKNVDETDWRKFYVFVEDLSKSRVRR